MNDYELFRVFLDCFNEVLARFEGGDVMSLDSDGLVLGDVAGSFLSSVFHNVAAEASQINVLTIDHGLLDRFHESFNDSLHAILFITGAVGNFINDFCFSHNFIRLIVTKFFRAAKIQ